MKTETYKGRKLKVVRGRGRESGFTRTFINGVEQYQHLGNEDGALRSLRGTIDHADEVGVASGRYGAHWYAPGTYELCPEGHAKPLDGPCGHLWCVEQRTAVDTRTEGFYVTVRAAAGARQDGAQPERCTHCTHPKGDHDGRADHRAKYPPHVAGDPWCHACNAPCDYAAGTQR